MKESFSIEENKKREEIDQRSLNLVKKLTKKSLEDLLGRELDTLESYNLNRISNKVSKEVKILYERSKQGHENIYAFTLPTEVFSRFLWDEYGINIKEFSSKDFNLGKFSESEKAYIRNLVSMARQEKEGAENWEDLSEEEKQKIRKKYSKN